MKEIQEPLEECLETARRHFEPCADGECENDKKRDDYPACYQCIGDGNPPQAAKLLGGENDMDSLFHKSRFYHTTRYAEDTVRCHLIVSFEALRTAELREQPPFPHP